MIYHIETYNASRRPENCYSSRVPGRFLTGTTILARDIWRGQTNLEGDVVVAEIRQLHRARDLLLQLNCSTKTADEDHGPIDPRRSKENQRKKEIFFREGEDNGRYRYGGLQGKRSSMGSMRRSSPAGAGPGEAIAEGWGTQREISVSGRWVRRREVVEGREKRRNEEIKKRNTDLALVFVPTFVFVIAGRQSALHTLTTLRVHLFMQQKKYADNVRHFADSYLSFFA
jgi:hypothetical protein